MVTRRRTLTSSLGLGVALTALLAAVFLASACAGTVPSASSHSTPSSMPSSRAPKPPVPSAAGVPSPSRSTPPTAARGANALVSAPAGFPGAPRPYAEAVLGAWAQRQVTRLGDLTSPAVRQQILELPGLPNQQWTYQRCDGAAGSSYCSFVNADGDAITLRVLNQQVGTAHATTEVRIDRTAYPNDAGEYVKGFVEAWRNANAGRMRALASPSEVEYFTRHTPPDTYSVCTFPVGSVWQVRVFNVDGVNYLIRLSAASLGTKRAIVGHTDPAPLPPPCS